MLRGIRMIDIEFNHHHVHLRGLREADRAAVQSLQVCPEIQVVSLDVELLRFADRVALCG